MQSREGTFRISSLSFHGVGPLVKDYAKFKNSKHTKSLLGRYCQDDTVSSYARNQALKAVCVGVCVRKVAHMSACVYIHIYVYVYLSVRALFLGVCGQGVFDFKAPKMKPKTWEKLTKHTDPRWLIGREGVTS